jgi:hypothetical protein
MATVGKAIYTQFETVINLTEQKRITDKVWMDILQRSRVGECTSNDLKEIRKLIITDPECKLPDFNSTPWKTAVLITPRNCVRNAWNRLALRRHCKETGNVLYICDAEDTIGHNRQPANMEQKFIIAGMNQDESKKLTYRTEFAKGMQVISK